MFAYDSLIGQVPVDTGEVLEGGVGDDYVRVGAALGVAFAELGSTVGQPADVDVGVNEAADHLK